MNGCGTTACGARAHGSCESHGHDHGHRALTAMLYLPYCSAHGTPMLVRDVVCISVFTMQPCWKVHFTPWFVDCPTQVPVRRGMGAQAQPRRRQRAPAGEGLGKGHTGGWSWESKPADWGSSIFSGPSSPNLHAPGLAFNTYGQCSPPRRHHAHATPTPLQVGQAELFSGSFNPTPDKDFYETLLKSLHGLYREGRLSSLAPPVVPTTAALAAVHAEDAELEAFAQARAEAREEEAQGRGLGGFVRRVRRGVVQAAVPAVAAAAVAVAGLMLQPARRVLPVVLTYAAGSVSVGILNGGSSKQPQAGGGVPGGPPGAGHAWAGRKQEHQRQPQQQQQQRPRMI